MPRLLRSLWGPALLLLFAVLCLPGVARAVPTIAVLDLDGYGVSYDSVQVMSQGVRDGFLEVGDFDPISGYQIADLMAAGFEEDLKNSRSLLAEARLDADSGNVSTALRKLDQVLAMHERARSWVGRRPELADAHYFTAVALARAGRNSEALDHLKEVLYLYPAYEVSRAVSPTPAIRSLFDQANREITAAGPRNLPGTLVSAVGKQIGTTNVVHGYVLADGTLCLRMYRDGTVVSEVKGRLAEIPLQPGDPNYAEIATRLTAGGSGSSGSRTTASRPTTTSPTTSSADSQGFYDLPPIDSEEEEALAAEDSAGIEEEAAEKQKVSKEKARKNKPAGRIHGGNSIRVGREPITRRWWFWVGLTAIVGGGAGYYVYTQIDTTEGSGDPDQRHPPRDAYGVELEL